LDLTFDIPVLPSAIQEANISSGVGLLGLRRPSGALRFFCDIHMKCTEVQSQESQIGVQKFTFLTWEPDLKVSRKRNTRKIFSTRKARWVFESALPKARAQIP